MQAMALPATMRKVEITLADSDRGIYEQLLIATGCRPAELLFVDDRAKNVAGAAAVGIPAIEFTGPHVYQELSERLFARRAEV